MNDEERQLWQIGDLECVMISCCSGAELQVREVRLKPDPTGGKPRPVRTRGGGKIVRRELYPTKSDLYERARDLRAEYEALSEKTAESGKIAEKR